MSATIQSRYSAMCFVVFDENDKKVKYSKYNFKFDTYNADLSLNLIYKRDIFYDFLVRNNSSGGNSDLRYPFSVAQSLEQYFILLTESSTPKQSDVTNYFNTYGYTFRNFTFTQLSSYASSEAVAQHEFDLYSYNDTEISRICQFLMQINGIYYTKYNFNFENYSNDFKIYGSKLCIFFDFVFRMLYLSGNVIGYTGFASMPDNFKQYFDITHQETLVSFLETSSIMSELDNVKKSVKNIDFRKYNTDNNLGFSQDEAGDALAKEYFYEYGQFEQKVVSIIPQSDSEIKQLTKSVCSVFSGDKISSGFLFSGSSNTEYINGIKQIYLVTCYHIISESYSKETILAAVQYDNDTNIKLQFRIIGYDIYSDICIAIYDSDLDYNKEFYPEGTGEGQWDIRNKLQTIKIVGESQLYIGQKISTIGTIGFNDNNAYLEGVIIDPNYMGPLTESYYLSPPSNILTDIDSSHGMSGSPLFIKNSSDKFICIGMFNGKLGDAAQFSYGVSSCLFSIIVQNGINYWHTVSKSRLIAKNYLELQYYVQGIIPKKWLGIKFSYFNSVLTKQNFPQVSNFPLNSGLVVEEFVLGFNKQTNSFVTNYIELTQQNIIKINTPLLNSNMYSKYLSNNKVPIIITSIKFYDLVLGDFRTFKFGRYQGQDSYDAFTYGFIQSGSAPNESQYVGIKRLYNNITVNYYFHNGADWELATEIIGGNAPTDYNIFEDNIYKYYQHKFDFPTFLNPYLNPYELNIMGGMERDGDGWGAPLEEFGGGIAADTGRGYNRKATFRKKGGMTGTLRE